jgi:prepilin-type N-terminal cleavage/methylation domain-containing protein
MRRPASSLRPRGFTLIELMVVIIVISILAALLLPAIIGAVNAARNAQVTAEINGLATALADFKTKFGDYPPSRIILREDGAFDTTSTLGLGSFTFAGNSQPMNAGANGVYGADVTYGALAQRSLRFLRRFWPRVNFSSTSTAPSAVSNTPGGYYDFNGDSTLGWKGNNIATLLQGHEALVFFLGGIPRYDATTQRPTGVTGFGKSPTNPFVSTQISNNRVPPFFEFRSERLYDDDGDLMPGYVDPLALAFNPDARYYAYFYSYGNSSYDPNDVNFPEVNDNVSQTALIGRAFQVNFLTAGNFPTNVTGSPAPNPYTSSVAYTPNPAAGLAPPAVYQNPESFQIISAGRDRLYGIGGQYLPASANDRLPMAPYDFTDPVNSGGNIDPGVRQRERDNLSNFATGKLD